MKIFTNTKTLDRFISSYTDSKEYAEYIILGSRKLDGIDEFPRLKGIFKCGVGLDNLPDTDVPIGLPSDRTRNIIYDEVAAFTCGLILRLCYENMGTVDPWVKQCRKSFASNNLLIVGHGSIGKRVGATMSNLCSITTYDIGSEGLLEEHVRKADIVSLHLPATPNTYEIIKAEWFKKNARIINTARGNLINEDDLFRFLSDNKEASCAYDVFWQEPYKGKLLELDNFYATPHVASTCHQFIEGLYSDFLDFVERTK